MKNRYYFSERLVCVQDIRTGEVWRVTRESASLLVFIFDDQKYCPKRLWREQIRRR